jgi:hypothetical protein
MNNINERTILYGRVWVWGGLMGFLVIWDVGWVDGSFWRFGVWGGAGRVYKDF